MTFLELVETKSHPVLQAPSHVKSDLLPGELSAARAHGLIPDITMTALNNWFDLPRETRAFLVAAAWVESVRANIHDYDNKPWWEKHFERLRKAKGGK